MLSSAFAYGEPQVTDWIKEDVKQIYLEDNLDENTVKSILGN